MFKKKYLILIPIFYLLVILQESFLIHFKVFGAALNLVLIAVVLVNFFGSDKKSFGIFTGILGGLILDLSSVFPFGTFIVTLAILSFLIQKTVSFFQKSNLLSFSAVFLFSFCFYRLFSSLLAAGIGFCLQMWMGASFGGSVVSFLNFGPKTLGWGFVYNIIFAAVAFLVLQKIHRKTYRNGSFSQGGIEGRIYAHL